MRFAVSTYRYNDRLDFFSRQSKLVLVVVLVYFIPAFFHLSNASENKIFFSSIPVETGLSQMTVSAIYQDSRGYLWFGTRDGLNRFDGYGFEIFRNNPADSFSISNNNINSICGDDSGNIWVATENGINCYQYSDNHFLRINKRNDNRGISHHKVSALHFDKKGRLWIGTEQGLDLYHPSENTFTRTTLDGILYNNRILSVFHDSYDYLWIGTLLTGLIRYQPATGHYEVFRNRGQEQNGRLSNTVRTIFEDTQRNLWIGTKSGLYQYNRRNNNFLTFGRELYNGKKLSNNGIRCLTEDREGNLLIGTNEGLNILHPGTGELEIYNSQINTEGNLNHYYVYSMFVDNAGTVWIGSFMGGINYYHKYNQQFRFNNLHGSGERLYGGAGPIAEANGKIWIGTGGGGLFGFDQVNNSYAVFRLNDSSFISNIVRSLYIRKDTIFLSTDENNLVMLNSRTLKILGSWQLNSNPALKIYPERDGKLLLCVRDTLGLREFSIADGRSHPLTYTIPGNPVKMVFPYATCSVRENDSVWWIGTRFAGLYRFNTVSGTVIRFTSQAGNPQSLSVNHISAIHIETGNSLWIGTNGGGLCHLDPRTAVFTTFSEREGLSNNVIFEILPDKAGFLWMTTLSGISRFDPVRRSFVSYTYGNGFPLQEPTDNSLAVLADGRFCAGGNNGIVTFDPLQIESNPFVPPVHLIEFRLLRSKTDRRDTLLNRKFPANGEKVILKSNQSSFVIRYTALNYIFPDKNQYAYQLEGFDYDWNFVGKQRMAIYTNLHSGKYRFRVKASNNDGKWNEVPAFLDIKILPPPWLSWYAYLIYLLLFSGLTWLLLHYIKLENRVRMKQFEQENMERDHQLRIRMFTNFSHELRTPLTLILGPLEDLLERTDIDHYARKSLKLIQKNAHRLLLVVNQLLDFRKQQSGKMELKTSEGNFTLFMREISVAFSELAEKKRIRYTFNCTHDPLTLWFDRLLLEKVFLNLLSNAFRNTPEGGEISVSIAIRPGEEIKKSGLKLPLSLTIPGTGYIETTVADNGCGISEEDQQKIFDPFYQVQDESHDMATGTGIGLSLCKGIVELHSGIITVDSRKGEGSRFIVYLPAGKEHLKPDEISTFTGDGEDISHYLLSFDAADQEDKMTGTSDTGKKTVLVIEDNPEVRIFIGSHLKNAFNISLAENGDEGYLKATEDMPDLVISDVMMPGMNGIELCNRLKNNVSTSHIPVILLTALSDLTSIKHGFEVGADDYITKPFNPALLRMKVKSLLVNRELLRKSFSKKFPFEKTFGTTSPVDELFLNRIYEILENHLSDAGFDIDRFSRETGMSRANLYRKIKALTNYSPNDLIRNYRLRAAVRLIEEQHYTVSEISYMVGFTSPAYFSNCFKKTFGLSPSEYELKCVKNLGDLP